MTTLVEKLQTSAKKFDSIACFGMDPVPSKLPESLTKTPKANSGFYGADFLAFYQSIIMEMLEQNVYPGAFKPNEGFFSRHDSPHQPFDPTFHASRDLARIIREAKNTGIPIIFDAKRGDIGPSSENYARELVDVWNADAITVSPYMGTDSVEPFLKARAAYVLCRTSNPGGKELQNLLTITKDDLERFGWKPGLYDANTAARMLEERTKPLYLRVADRIIEWDSISPGNVGAVVGATNMDELKDIARYFVQSGKKIPLLIPGIGKQGGSAKDVVTTLREVGYDLSIVRINSSSDLNFAWQKEGKPDDYAGAAVRALKRLNDEIGYKEE